MCLHAKRIECAIFKQKNDSWHCVLPVFTWKLIVTHLSKILSVDNSKVWVINLGLQRTKRRRSDPVLWQKPLYQQKCQRDKVTTQTTPQKSSNKQQLRTDLGRSVGVTTATQLVWLTGLRAHLPTPRNSRVIKRTHI